MFPCTSNLWVLALLPILQLSNAHPASANLPVEVIHQFPLGTWIENMVVRPSGSVLAIDLTAPNIFEIPICTNSTATLIHAFSNATEVSSICESSVLDVYFAITGSFNFVDFTPVPGSYALHRVAFDPFSGTPIVAQVATLESLIMPNGMIAIPFTPYLLIADSIAGIVYRFDTSTLKLTTYLDHPLLKPSGTSLQAGVNGIKLSRDHFYFSNTNQELVARVPVWGVDAAPRGTPQIVVSQTVADDFIVDEYNGDIFIAENGINDVAYVGGRAKGANSTLPTVLASVAGPSAVVWARGKEGRTLIVSTDGGVLGYLTGNHTIGGSISLIHIEKGFAS